MSAINRLALNTLHSALAGLSIVLGGFVSNVLVARLLGVEASGIVAFATWAIAVGVMLGDLGVPGTLARYLPDLEARGMRDEAVGLVHWLFCFNLAAAVIMLCAYVGYVAAARLAHRAQVDAHLQAATWFWGLVAAACIAQALAGFVNGALKGEQRFATMAKLAAACAASQIALTGAGAMLFGAVGALSGAVAAGVVPLVLLPHILRRGRQVVPTELKRRARRFAFESWLAYLVTAFAWARMEIFFLEMNWGSHAVALFAVSLTLANLATQGPLLLTGGLLPYLSRQSGLGSERRPQETYAMSVRLLALFISPMCLGTAAIAPALVPAIYGEGFAGAVPSTVVLLCGAAVTAWSSVAFTYMLAMERTRFVVVTGGMAALLVIVCGLTLIPSFGVMAAATARVLIQAGVAFATMSYLAFYLNCPTPMAALIRILAASAICALVARIGITFVPGPAGIALAVLLGAGAYAAAVRLLKPLPRSDIERLLNALTVLPPFLRIPAAQTIRLIAA